MNTKYVNVLYGLALIVLIPIAVWLFLTNRELVGNTEQQQERLEQIENKVFQLEKQPTIESDNTPDGQQEATPAAGQLIEEETDLDSLDQYAIQVLNARGVQGIAGDVQETLEEAGYYVANIDNATWQPESTISVKSGLEDLADQVQQELSADYNFVSVDTLSEDSEYDVVIYIGSE